MLELMFYFPFFFQYLCVMNVNCLTEKKQDALVVLFKSYLFLWSHINHDSDSQSNE